MRPSWFIALPLMMTMSCARPGVEVLPPPREETPPCRDSLEDCDRDGYKASEGDCDPGDPDINPGEPERCDGIDNNCDGLIDDSVTTTFYADDDADGWGGDAVRVEGCEPVEGLVSEGGDCDDDNDAIHPGAIESCNEVDDDCDDQTDEDCP